MEGRPDSILRERTNHCRVSSRGLVQSDLCFKLPHENGRGTRVEAVRVVRRQELNEGDIGGFHVDGHAVHCVDIEHSQVQRALGFLFLACRN